MYRQRQLIFLFLLLTGTVAAILWIVVATPDETVTTEEPLPEPLLEEDATIEDEPALEGAHPLVEERIPDVDPDGPRLYLVLDDAGQSMEELWRFAAFPDVFTVAVLPDLPFSREISREARVMGHDVILHLPMEAFNGQDPGPGAIFADDTPEQIRTVLRRHIETYPEVTGANNHMGSRVTSDPQVMEIVLHTLHEAGWYFLDSRTTHLSVVPAVGERLSIPVLTRHVFLDHERTQAAIRRQLDLALDHARDHGYVIMIGHMTVPETAEVLIERYPEIDAEGFRFLPISSAVEETR